DGAEQSNHHLTVYPGSHAELALEAEVAAVGTAPVSPPVLMPLLLELAHSASPEAVANFDRVGGWGGCPPLPGDPVHPDPAPRARSGGDRGGGSPRPAGPPGPGAAPVTKGCG